MLSSSPGWTSNVSQAELLVTRACSPHLQEPNYALHLEVAEYINQKKANTPREAAMMIARIVNNRNPHVAMLALALLETLVQSCGYPFHLQIATKEFLNELVRRFPERPPPFPGPVMSRILDLINDWKEGIAAESRWKEDLGNVRDMHRLLTFKGYRFRDRPRPPPIASASNLKSAEELEQEDRVAQEAKLQELIRRGTPRDLAAAQELMKTLAGANPDAKPDYRTQSLTELNKLESKVILLNEILDNVDTTRGEKFVKGDVYDQVASILTEARPKIQGWISNAETDDPESLDTFLQINDQLNSVLNRYECYKNGDYAAASNPIPPELGGGRPNDLSLIDFDDSSESANIGANSSSGVSGHATSIDELASLFGPSAQPVSGAHPQSMGMRETGGEFGMRMGSGMGMGTGMGMNMSAPAPSNMTINGFTSGMGMGTRVGAGPSPALNQATRPVTASPHQDTQLGMIRIGTPQAQLASGSGPLTPISTQTQMPNYYSSSSASPAIGMGTGSGARMGGMGMTGQSGMQPIQPQQIFGQQQRPTNVASNPTGGTQGKDPFADLVGLF
ncbi:uncharacterized protein FIBRA_05579 [Fibroporia radiculosa]|uniref:VHS domain-containing protein n=1 Tax=Fibroporia radiculosa TaxID=599839 RepID=J4IAT0_9APHY|nr:uncharacterized protein FIBRA_05579 [Fibroporia radiculosa]CCM03446.1 predicted protein [Fibroporia radiculosa]